MVTAAMTSRHSEAAASPVGGGDTIGPKNPMVAPGGTTTGRAHAGTRRLGGLVVGVGKGAVPPLVVDGPGEVAETGRPGHLGDQGHRGSAPS